MSSIDVVVIGGGIAGASAAYEIAKVRTVLLVERESQPGYHSTGRSVATFSETYGNPTIRALTSGSRKFFEQPPPGFCENPLLLKRGVLTIGRSDQFDRVCATAEQLTAKDRSIRFVTGAEAKTHVPLLRSDYVKAAILKPKVMDIDVNGLHQGFLRGARQHGAQIKINSAVDALDRSGGLWQVKLSTGDAIDAKFVVNAAGAWADVLASLANIPPLGLTPLRRTALTLPIPPSGHVGNCPMVVDIDEKFYFKPESGRLLASPCDETPVEPCDIRPDEIDIARCVDQVEQATELSFKRVDRAWAGLRTFLPDRTPVVGFETKYEGFLWLAGQGGYGIQTAPSMARLAAAFLEGRTVPADLADLNLTDAQLSPDRIRRRHAMKG